jgi:hypothetical protein
MKKNIFILLSMLSICVLLLSCQERASRPPVNAPNADNSDTTSVTIASEKVRLDINNPIDIWQTDYLSFEVSHREDYNTSSRGLFDESSYKEVKSVGAKCWNLMFYNTKTQEYYLLDADKKMLIYAYKLNDTAHGKVVRNMARYDLQFDDNQDGKFTNADAKRLFISSRLGKGLRQVSPEKVSVSHYQFAPKGDFIIIYGIKDTNRDGFFDQKDRVFVYRLDMNQDFEKIVTAQLLVPKEFQDKLQKKVETEWLLPTN